MLHRNIREKQKIRGKTLKINKSKFQKTQLVFIERIPDFCRSVFPLNEIGYMKTQVCEDFHAIVPFPKNVHSHKHHSTSNMKVVKPYDSHMPRHHSWIFQSQKDKFGISFQPKSCPVFSRRLLNSMYESCQLYNKGITIVNFKSKTSKVASFIISKDSLIARSTRNT